MAGPPPEGMAACSICGRNFNEDRVKKHETICKKTMTKKRKVFDVTKQRVEVRNLTDFIHYFQRTRYPFPRMIFSLFFSSFCLEGHRC